jgi:hypothetical protein
MRAGDFEVLSVDGDHMRIRLSRNNEERDTSVALESRILKNRPAVASKRPQDRYRALTLIKTVQWDLYSDHAQRIATRLQTGLKPAFPYAYQEHPGSHSIQSEDGKSVIAKIVPLDENLADVAHLGTGALVGFRAELYERLALDNRIPAELRATSPAYRIGVGLRRWPFYLLPVPDDATAEALLPHLIPFIQRFRRLQLP